MKVVAFNGSPRRDGNTAALIGQTIVIVSSYWNIGIGYEKGAVEEDREGVQTMRTLGKKMAWAMKRLYA